MNDRILIQRENNYSAVYSQLTFEKNEVIMSFADCKYVKYPTQYSLQIGICLHIDTDILQIEKNPEKYMWRYLNHSCNANCYFDPEKLELIALTFIKPNTQLTINYLCSEYEMESPFTCNCGEPSCVKQIWGYKFLSKTEKQTLSNKVSSHVLFLDNMEKYIEELN